MFRPTTLVIVALAVAGLAPGCMPPERVKVALVDGTRVIRETRRGKALREKIRIETDRLTKQLAMDRLRINKLLQEIKGLTAARPANKAAIAAKRKLLARYERQLRGKHTKLQDQLNRHGQKLLDDFKNAIRKVAMAVRDEQGLDLVILKSKGEGLWVWPVTDITELVIKALDSGEGE